MRRGLITLTQLHLKVTLNIDTIYMYTELFVQSRILQHHCRLQANRKERTRSSAFDHIKELEWLSHSTCLSIHVHTVCTRLAFLPMPIAPGATLVGGRVQSVCVHSLHVCKINWIMYHNYCPKNKLPSKISPLLSWTLKFLHRYFLLINKPPPLLYTCTYMYMYLHMHASTSTCTRTTVDQTLVWISRPRKLTLKLGEVCLCVLDSFFIIPEVSWHTRERLRTHQLTIFIKYCLTWYKRYVHITCGKGHAWIILNIPSEFSTFIATLYEWNVHIPQLRYRAIKSIL